MFAFANPILLSTARQQRSATLLLRHSRFAQRNFLASARRVAPYAVPPTPAVTAPVAAGTTAKTPRMPAIIRPVVPSEQVLQLGVEDRAQLRTEVIKAVTNYIRKENLQDPADKRRVYCDPLLKSLLGVDQCNLIQLSKYLAPHMRKPEDLGGHYLEEAKLQEQRYLERKALEGPPTTPRRKPKTDAPRPRKPRPDAPILRPYILSDDLATICRAKELSRPSIVKAIWAYIRLNNLQAKAGEPVRSDFLLKKIYGVDELTSKGIMKGISAHVTKKE